MTSAWVLVVIAVVIGIIVGIRKWIATENGRRIWDQVDAQAADLRAAVPQGGAGPGDQHARLADQLRRARSSRRSTSAPRRRAT